MPYDIVIGPVADDQAFEAIGDFYKKRDYSESAKYTLIEKLKTYKLADQYLLSSPKAISSLKFLNSERIERVIKHEK